MNTFWINLQNVEHYKSATHTEEKDLTQENRHAVFVTILYI